MRENTAKTAVEWVLVARSVAQLPGSQDQALRCMARAGVAAQDAADWLAVAKAWAQDFDDTEMARQCLTKSESFALDANGLGQIADAWEELTGSYEIADPLADSPYIEKESANSDSLGEPAFYEPGKYLPFGWFGEVWLLLEQGDLEGANACMTQIESLANSSENWMDIAEKWESEFNNSTRALQCMAKAESMAIYSGEWTNIAGKWNYAFNNYDKALQCMAKAESMAVEHFEWTNAASTWNYMFNDSDKVLQCMMKAESMAKRVSTGRPWRRCGR